jgi:predicted permease
MILQHLFPVFFLLLLGYVLKRKGITNAAFLKTTDGLIYYIFFPLLLFWKIGGSDTSFDPQSIRFYLSVTVAVVILYLLSLIAIRVLRISNFEAGAFSQSCYRFNTYVGVAVVSSVLGEEGVAQFGVLIGFIIPMINVLAVITLIWFTKPSTDHPKRASTIISSIVRNPLILGCAAGIIYARVFTGFPQFVENTLGLAASVTLPLALLSIGGTLTLNTVRRYLRPTIAAAVLKLLILPVLGYGIMTQLAVSGLFLHVGMIFFALPTSTAIYVLSSQLQSDTELASAAIALSTLLSFFSLSAVLGLLIGSSV